MDANTYQAEAKRTLIPVPDRPINQDEIRIAWAALSIAIAAAKLVEHIKKGIFHQHGLDLAYMSDCLASIDNLCHLQDVIPAPVNLSGEDIVKLWVLTGLVGEAGEIAELITGDIARGDMLPSHLKDELGDLAWYWSSLATQYSLSLNDILIGNVEKLLKRYQNGYSSEASRNRAG